MSRLSSTVVLLKTEGTCMHLGEDLHRKFAARALRLAREAHLCLPRAAGHRVR